MLRTRRKSFGNIVGHVKGVTNVNSLMEWTANQFDLTLDWTAVEKIKKMWNKRHPDKEIHMISLTFDTLKKLYNINEFKELFIL